MLYAPNQAPCARPMTRSAATVARFPTTTENVLPRRRVGGVEPCSASGNSNTRHGGGSILILVDHRVIRSMSAAGVVFVRPANNAKSAIVISRAPASIRLTVLRDICNALATSSWLRSASFRAPESTAAVARFQRFRNSSISFRKSKIRVALVCGPNFAGRCGEYG